MDTMGRTWQAGGDDNDRNILRTKIGLLQLRQHFVAKCVVVILNPESPCDRFQGERMLYRDEGGQQRVNLVTNPC